MDDLTVIGTPNSGNGCSSIMAYSARHACAMACSDASVAKALSLGSTVSILSRYAFTTSTGESFFRRISLAVSVTDRAVIEGAAAGLGSTGLMDIRSSLAFKRHGRGAQVRNLPDVVLGGEASRERCIPHRSAFR